MMINEIQIREIAVACHRVNKYFCKTLGDNSHPDWEYTSKHTQDSLIEGVRNAIENDFDPIKSHTKWLQYKIENGWTYGKVKDPVKKTHPCILSYHDLSLQDQTKDYIFCSIVKSNYDRITKGE